MTNARRVEIDRKNGWEQAGRTQADADPFLRSTTGVAAAIVLFTRDLVAHSPATRRKYRGDCRTFMLYLADTGLDPTAITVSDLPADVLDRFYLWCVVRYGREQNYSIHTLLGGVRQFFAWCASYDQTPGNRQYSLLTMRLKRTMGKKVMKTRRVDFAAVLALATFAATFTVPPVPDPGTAIAEGNFYHAHNRMLSRVEMQTRYLAALRDKAIILTLFATGMRRAEVVSLNRADVEAGDEAEAIITGKGQKERVVFFGTDATIACRIYLAARTDDAPPLFLTHTGTGTPARLSPSGVSLIVARWAMRAGAGHVSPHAFRHNLATYMLNDGAALDIVQDILGHASPATTKMIYAHYQRQALRKAMHDHRPRLAQ